jgi:hypothetical protein
MQIMPLLQRFANLDNAETATAYFRTRIARPEVGSNYLNIVFKGATEAAIEDNRDLQMPHVFLDFLRSQNGAILFAGWLNIFGLHECGQLLDREDPFAQLPFNIVDENESWPPHDTDRFLAIGSYMADGSTVCIHRTDSRVYLFRREDVQLASKPTIVWDSITSWVTSEITRLSLLFDRYGNRLAPECETVPSRIHYA